jgi:hypothetical protein
MFRAYITVRGGRTRAFIKNTQKITSALKIPKLRSGINGDNAVARNAALVVNDVTKIACSARFIVCLILFGSVGGTPFAVSSSTDW